MRKVWEMMHSRLHACISLHGHQQLLWLAKIETFSSPEITEIKKGPAAITKKCRKDLFSSRAFYFLPSIICLIKGKERRAWKIAFKTFLSLSLSAKISYCNFRSVTIAHFSHSWHVSFAHADPLLLPAARSLWTFEPSLTRRQRDLNAIWAGIETTRKWVLITSFSMGKEWTR